MGRYLYLGSAQRIYTQYADTTAGGSQPLTAVPGGSYEMTPGPGQPGDLPVPPGDGLWEPAGNDDAGQAAAPAGKTAAKGTKGGGE